MTDSCFFLALRTSPTLLNQRASGSQLAILIVISWDIKHMLGPNVAS